MHASSAPPPSAPLPAPPRAQRARIQAIAVALAAAVLLVVVAIRLERNVTWYLAVDQYGYLTFAQDLMHGKVFHDWPLLRALQRRLPARIDVLSQTYVYDHGRLYCRYAPGFPLILAGWMRLFGENAAHALNPIVFLALLGLVLAYLARALGDRWRALVGTALVVLCPTFLHLWALTPVRDLSAHLAGVGGLFLLLPVAGRVGPSPARAAAAGLAIGYAGSIRPDALIYVAPAFLVATWQWLQARMAPRRVAAAFVGGGLGVLVGLAPFLVYNHLATGNALRPTQGMELDHFLPAAPTEQAAAPAAPPAGEGRVGYAPLAWRGGTQYGVQGGGVRLANFPHTLRGNIALLRQNYGDTLLGLAVVGALLAMVQRPALFLTAVPYCVLALVLFSFWSRPDGRYLSGVFVFVPMLIVEGTFGPADLVARLTHRVRPAVALAAGLAAAAALVAAAFMPPVAPAGALPVLTVVVPLVAAAALVASLASRHALAAAAAPALAIGLVGLTATRALTGEQRRASFQRPQMERARDTVARTVRPRALIITTEDVGRPADNIDYYSGVAKAVYQTDLQRWRVTVWEAAFHAARIGMTPYLLLPVGHPRGDEMLANLRRVFGVELVADIPPERAIDWFVAAAFHRGVHMQLHRIDVPAGYFSPQRRWK